MARHLCLDAQNAKTGNRKVWKLLEELFDTLENHYLGKYTQLEELVPDCLRLINLSYRLTGSLLCLSSGLFRESFTKGSDGLHLHHL